MRNPILSKLTKLSRLPSTSMEVRLDSTFDALPNIVGTFMNSGSVPLTTNVTETQYVFAQFGMQAGSQINTSRLYYEFTASLTSNDKGRYAGYITITPNVPSAYQLSNIPIDSQFANSQIEPYVYGHDTGSNTFPAFGVIDTAASPTWPVTHLKLNRIGTTFDYSSSFMVKQGSTTSLPEGVIQVIAYFAKVQSDDITPIYPDQAGSVTFTLKNITPGRNYGTICASCTATVSLQTA